MQNQLKGKTDFSIVWGWTAMSYACCWKVFKPAVELFQKYGATPDPIYYELPNPNEEYGSI